MNTERLKNRVNTALSVEEEQPQKTIPSAEQLRRNRARRNENGEPRPEYSDAYMRSIVKGQRRWERFCDYMGISDWRSELKNIDFKDKGLIEIFVDFLVAGTYKKYTGRSIDDRFFAHVKSTIAQYKHLRTEQSQKNSIGPDAFLYLSHFRWVRDNKTVFYIGLDRLDDATLRILQMFTGARTHEFVIAKTADPSTIANEYYDKHDYYGYLLFPLGILLHSLWHTRGHPIETVYVLLSAFDGQYYSRHIDFRITRYYGRLTRARMQSDLRSALVDTFFNPGDAIVVALGQAVSRWRQWCRRDRGPLYALFDAFAVETVEATTGRKVNVWTQDRFAAFVASRLGGNSGVAPILWRSFCYSALYPFTLRLAACPAEDQQLDLNEWVQAVAMLATDAANHVHYARPVTSITGRSIWYEFTCLAVCSGPQQHHPRSDPSNASSDETRPPTVLEQVAYIASAQLPLDYAIRGPRLPEILPHVRKLVNDAECEPVVETDFAIPYRDMLCLFGAVLQVHKPDLDAARRNTWLFKNRGLGLTTTDIDRATHLAVAKQILAVAGVYDQDEDGDVTISYKQYKALWNRLYLTTNEPWHRGEKWSFHHELGLLWRSLFSVVSVVDDLKGLNHNSRGIDETPNHPPPPLVLQALDFLYPLPSCGCTRQRRRKHTLQYTSAAGGGLSREGVLAALTKHYRPTLVVLYGHTTDKRRQSALFTVLMSSPLWCTCHSGRIDDFFVDDKHLLLEMAPRARVLQYQPATNKHKTIFADLVEIDDMADTISFGSRSGLLLDLAAGVATLSSAVEPADAGHYVEIPTGPPQTTTPEAMAAAAAWTTSMHITKLEVYTASDGVDQNLAVMRGLRSIRRRPKASVGRDR